MEGKPGRKNSVHRSVDLLDDVILVLEVLLLAEL